MVVVIDPESHEKESWKGRRYSDVIHHRKVLYQGIGIAALFGKVVREKTYDSNKAIIPILWRPTYEGKRLY